MKFIVSSNSLQKKLQILGGVINSSNTIPILDHFLFQLDNSKLTITSSDLETQQIESDGIIVGHILKSSSENKQYTEQRHYTNETENGAIVGRAVSYRTYITGSYLDTLTTPTLQIVGTREKDRSVLKG